MLYKKMWRDLKSSKTQFIAIFLMAFLSSFVFVGLDCEVSGFERGIYRYYEETNLSDMWVNGAVFTRSDVDTLLKLDEVEDAQLRTQVNGYVVLNGEDVDCQFNFIDENKISKMKYVCGDEYTQGTYGVWLDYLFLEKNNLSVGDTVNMKIGGYTFTEVIRGGFRNPEYVYYLPDASSMMPEYGTFAFCFLSAEEYPSEQFAYTQILVDLKDVDNSGGIDSKEKEIISRMKDEIPKVLENSSIVATDKSQSLSYETFASEIDQHRTMAYSFPIVFMLIAVLGIITTMSRMTANQRIQIGTMKALGFGRRTIMMHYISYGLVLCLAGSIAGAFVAYYSIADFIMGMMTGTYLTPYHEKVITFRSVIMIAAATVVAGIASYGSCHSILKENAAVILKPPAPKVTKTSAFEKTKLWLSLNFSTQWNIRDIQRNKVRSLMGMAGVAGCTMLLVCAFGCNDSMYYVFDWMYGKLVTSNYKIVFEDDASYGFVYDTAKKYDGQMIEEAAIEIWSDNAVKTGTLTVTDDGNYYHFQNGSLENQVLSENGVAISYKMAQILGVSEGDIVYWSIVGVDKTHMSRIEQLFRIPTGQGLAMRRSTLEACGETFSPTSVLTNRTIPPTLTDDEYVSGVQSMEELRSGLESMAEMMLMMVVILIVAAVMLGVVVLYNMGVLSFIEKIREISTLKVLGFSTKTIRNILQKQNIWITAIGCIIGIPLGNALLAMIFGTMGDSMDYVAIVSPKSYLFSVVGTFLVSVIVNRLLSGKVRTINMVEALKGVE